MIPVIAISDIFQKANKRDVSGVAFKKVLSTQVAALLDLRRNLEVFPDACRALAKQAFRERD